MARHKPLLTTAPVSAEIETMTHEGRGVARVAGKTVFIDGALPGEQVEFVYTRSRRSYDEGRLQQVLRPSPQRVTPSCEHFSVCGGCSLQHIDPAEQLRLKQQILLDDLQHIGRVSPDEILPPLTGPVWGYRKKARLGVRYVDKKGKILVGFREKGSHFLAELQSCKILYPAVGERLLELAQLVEQLSCLRRLPQIEVAVSDARVALVFRHLESLTEQDRRLLVEFGQAHDFLIYQQPGGPDTVSLLWPEAATLNYALPEFDVDIEFLPTDFTQVNSEINIKMVSRAVQLLALQPDDRVLELFCGLGNFSFALARRAARVVAVEGESGLIQRARYNARRNGLDNLEFHVANLYEDVSQAPWLRGQQYDKLLLDPPRGGALEIIPQLGKLKVHRLVYVSCNPATLARDAGELQRQGYRLVSAGVMDMFPHTAHVESIALFVRD